MQPSPQHCPRTTTQNTEKLRKKIKNFLRTLGLDLLDGRVVLDTGEQEAGEPKEDQCEDNQAASNDEMADACTDFKPAAMVTDQVEEVECHDVGGGDDKEDQADWRDT